MAKLNQLIKTVAAAATPERVVATPNTLMFSYATVVGQKDARTNNTGNVWLGITSANDTQPMIIAPGETRELKAPGGAYLDWYDFFLDVATDDDGLVIWFL